MSISELVTIVIVNWNGRHFLQNCLSSLQNQHFSNFDVIVVDNGSIDDSAQFIKKNFNEYQIIELRKNIGFSAANNIAINRTKTKYIATLNNDTIVPENWLENLVESAEKDDSVGMVAGKMYYQSTNIIDNIGLRINKNGLGTNIGNGEIDKGQFDNRQETFAPCAGAALYRKKMLNQIGLFDQDFFAYYEDLDIGWRARIFGWKCKFTPHSIVYHYHSGSSSPQKEYLLHRNKIFTLIKNLPTPLFIKYLPEIALTDFIISANSIFTSKKIYTIKAKRDALKSLPKMLKKRKIIQNNKKVSLKEIETWFCNCESMIQIAKRKQKK